MTSTQSAKEHVARRNRGAQSTISRSNSFANWKHDGKAFRCTLSATGRRDWPACRDDIKHRETNVKSKINTTPVYSRRSWACSKDPYTEFINGLHAYKHEHFLPRWKFHRPQATDSNSYSVDQRQGKTDHIMEFDKVAWATRVIGKATKMKQQRNLLPILVTGFSPVDGVYNQGESSRACQLIQLISLRRKHQNPYRKKQPSDIEAVFNPRFLRRCQNVRQGEGFCFDPVNSICECYYCFFFEKRGDSKAEMMGFV